MSPVLTQAPRGQVHKGYAGGAIEAPFVEPHVRLDEAVADALAEDLKTKYEAGASVQELVESTGYTTTRVRGLLKKANTQMRPRGRKTKQAEALFA